MENVQNFLADCFVKLLFLCSCFIYCFSYLFIICISIFIFFLIHPLHFHAEASVLPVSLVDSVTAKVGNKERSYQPTLCNLTHILYTLYIHCIYTLYTLYIHFTYILCRFYICFINFLVIFWTCSRHVPKKFWGSNMKFFQKVLGTFGLSFGIIGGV